MSRWHTYRFQAPPIRMPSWWSNPATAAGEVLELARKLRPVLAGLGLALGIGLMLGSLAAALP